MTDRLEAQFAFLNEADRLKSVMRATTLVDGSRRENSGEHSWHLALYALVLADQAGPGVSIDRVIRMLLIHDLVEIDVGDVPIHSQNGQAHASAATQAAETPDARFAKSLDRVQPVMANLMSGGGTWASYNVTFDQLETRVGSRIARGAPALWDWVREKARPWFG